MGVGFSWCLWWEPAPLCCQDPHTAPCWALGQDLLGTGTLRGLQPLSAPTDLLGRCWTLLEIGLKAHFSSLEPDSAVITWAGVMLRSPLAGDVPSSSSAALALLAAGQVLVPQHRLWPPLSALLLCVSAGTTCVCCSPLWVDTVLLICCVCTGIKVGRRALLHYKSAADLLMKQNTSQWVFGVPGVPESLCCIRKVSCIIKK